MCARMCEACASILPEALMTPHRLTYSSKIVTIMQQKSGFLAQSARILCTSLLCDSGSITKNTHQARNAWQQKCSKHIKLRTRCIIMAMVER